MAELALREPAQSGIAETVAYAPVYRGRDFIAGVVSNDLSDHRFVGGCGDPRSAKSTLRPAELNWPEAAQRERYTCSGSGPQEPRAEWKARVLTGRET